MSERTTVVIRRGRITIPTAVRRALNLNEGDRVVVTLHADGAKIARRESAAALTAGRFQSNCPPLSAEAEREAAERAVAEEAMQRMGS